MSHKFREKYEVLEFLGEGASGKVYRVESI